MKKQYWIFPLITLTMFVLLLAGFSPATEGTMQTLPTRPVPTSTPTPAPAGVAVVQNTSGGFISLTVSGIEQPSTLWTAVQWQNEHGDWFTIDGWQGEPTVEGDVTWFVGTELIGDETLFRWRVYEGEGGAWLATSDTFTLPQSNGRTTVVTLLLSE